MPYHSQSDMHAFYRHATQTVAASPKVGIRNVDLKSTIEIRQEMSAASPSTLALLDKFLDAYQAWYEVHVDVEKSGTAGNLTPQQDQTLKVAISTRDSTRSALQAAV